MVLAKEISIWLKLILMGTNYGKKRLGEMIMIEVNLFNKPRLSLWPVQQSPDDRNAKDRLLAFCSQTFQGEEVRPYYFQRESVHKISGGPSGGWSRFTEP